MLTNKRLLTGVKNTLLILVVSIFFNILLGAITAFIIERFEFRFKKVVVGLFFVGMLVPTFVTEIARFKIINGLGLYGSPGAPILIYVASDLMQLYIYRQFLSTLSVSLDESALLDGCNYFQLFTRIIFPLLAPATATVTIIKAITIINDMYIPYLYMPGNKQRTLTDPTVFQVNRLRAHSDHVCYASAREAVRGESSLRQSLDGHGAFPEALSPPSARQISGGRGMTIPPLERSGCRGNRLCVEVYKRSSAAWIEDQDFFRFSGIFRSVFLYAKPEVHLSDLWLQAGLEEDNTTGTLSIRLLLEGEGTLHCRIAHLGLGTLFDGPLTLTAENKYLRSQSFRFADVLPWDHDHPERYRVTLTLSALNGTVCEVAPYDIGFRRFELKGRLMLLNGTRLVFNGVNRHEGNPETGRAMDTFKRNNINPAYLVPQECGCHTDTRAIILHGKEGKSLSLKMNGAPFAFSALPYTPRQLEQAAHQEELPSPVRTVVTVCGAMRGVGGIDSWSSDVEKPYRIRADQDMEFSVAVQFNCV